jgi:prefoldin subunit 5
MNEQQTHLTQLVEQRTTLSQQLEGIQTQTTRTRELLLKTQGAIEYLEAVGVTLPEPEVTEEAEVAEEADAPKKAKKG